MNAPPDRRVTARHLALKAYLYVRQSTLRQVIENTESTHRQYDLRCRAVALGWPEDQVVVIDADLGHTAAFAEAREGFQQLVANVGMGLAGLVMGLEVSRLARNSSDWHRLVEICALTQTLILDEDGLYDPTAINDRVILGFKGTMSEVELHQIRARLQGGLLSKARRGELRLRLPVGFVYDAKGAVVLDPNEEVRRSIRLLFATYRRTGSAYATVRAFREEGLLFPKRLHTGPAKGDLVWAPLSDGRVFGVLRNPRYAGAFAYGKRKGHHVPDGRTVIKLVPRKDWIVLLPGQHEGYVPWEEYEKTQKRLAVGYRGKRKYPAREGPALLQGLVICGTCGARMSVRYHTYSGVTRPTYTCHGLANTQCLPACWSVVGTTIDEALADLLLEVVTPMAIEVTLAVQQELRDRIEEADALRRKRVERAEYETELARRRFLGVDPDHRLVADSLEADWNEKLRELSTCREKYERRRREDRTVLDEEAQQRIRTLAADFPRIWRHPETPAREKKRMARLILEDVTLVRLVKEEKLAVHVRFQGGATRSLSLPRPRFPWEDRRVSPEVVEEIDRMLFDHTHAEIAESLNEKGYVSGTGKSFDAPRVGKVQRAYGLESRYARLRKAGWLTLKDVARKLGICRATVKIRRAEGRLGIRALRLDDVGRYLYEDPGKAPAKTPALAP